MLYFTVCFKKIFIIIWKDIIIKIMYLPSHLWKYCTKRLNLMFTFVTSKVFKTFLPNETLLDINFLSIFLLLISIGCSEYWKLCFLILISQSIIFLLNFYTIHNKKIKSLFVCCNSFFEILSIFLYFFLTYFCISFFRILFLYPFLH